MTRVCLSSRPCLVGLTLTFAVLGCGRDPEPGDEVNDEVGESTSASETGVETGSELGSETGESTGMDTSETGDGDGDGDEQIIAFEAGSLIIPMDTDYQDMGMLEAFGLVYALLQTEVPINWAIAQGKQAVGDVDFMVGAIDLRTGDAIASHGYRGGPFVIAAADAAQAMPIITAWLSDNPNTNVHEAGEGFEVYVSRRLLSAPTIAIFADGNEDIARGYLLAAKIPDSNGDPTWPDDSPDMLDPVEVAGLSDSDHQDGALFGGGGSETPLYCQFMSMHWNVGDAVANPEVVAEVRTYLGFPVHFFAECQAVNAFENIGHFLTPAGLEIADQPSEYSFHRLDTPFGQIDGPFVSVGGSEPAYSVPAGDAYFQSDTTLITDSTSAEGIGDVWMTGYRDGKCPAAQKVCPGAGKVSYLGGHAYDVKLPISQNPSTQGTRLFLNSLFEAPCAFKR